ncbi:hypothetical protein [Pilimelia anulata]|nr:hypothetical protein [Pilimelia anulata]
MAAAFTHMRDWTMTLMPAGTDEWFGWANAVISELLMFAGFLLLRRRIRRQEGYGGPLAVMIGGTALSLCAQIHSVGWDAGWDAKLLAALPALAFMVLIKLIMKEVDSAKKATAAAAAAEADRQAEKVRQAQALADARAEISELRGQAEISATAVAVAENRAAAEAENRAAVAAKLSAATAEHAAEISARLSELDAVGRELGAARQTAAAQAEAAAAARCDAAESRALAGRATEAAAGLQAELAEARQAADTAHAQVRAYADAAGQAKDTTAAAVAHAAAARAEADRLAGDLTAARAAAARGQEQIHEYAETARRLRAEVEVTRQATAAAEAHRADIEAQARQWGALADAEIARLKAENAELRRAARSTAEAEISGAVRGEISAPGGRRLAAVPEIPALPAGVTVPEVDGVRPEKVAAVMAAWHANPGALAPQLAEATGYSAPTVRKVLRVLAGDADSETTDNALERTA